MSQTRIAVPNGMTEAAFNEFFNAASLNGITRNLTDAERLQFALKAALQWLAENPMVPTDEQVAEMKTKLVPIHPHWANIVAEWQRRMFLAPAVDPQKCPHRWQAKLDSATMERVVYCELCDWVYSRDALEAIEKAREVKL